MSGIGNLDSLQQPTGEGAAKLKRKLKRRGMLLKEWRILSGHSMVGIAREMGVHWNTISNWESGGTIPSWALQMLIDMGWSANDAYLNLHGR